MAPVIVGIAALVAVLLLVRGFAYADPKSLLRLLRYFGAAGLGVVTVLMALTGRMALALFLGSMAWGLATGGHIWPAGWPHFPGNRTGANRKSATSSIRADWVEMELDHDTGEMRGSVLKGAHAGRNLLDLNRDGVIAVWCEASTNDPESARLLETYLDRNFGTDWREAAGGQRGSAGSDAMTRGEAFKILGLLDSATDDEIRAAYRRLMTQIHPDRGGSDYLAAKINQARDVLLGT